MTATTAPAAALAAVPATALRAELVEGSAADALLGDPAFETEWRALHAGCPWATVFQGPDFARVWHRVYRDRHAPLLAIVRDGAGALAGLLALAVHRATGRVAHVGEHHAEYHVWLARTELGDVVPELLLDALAARFPGARLRLLFLPPGSPVAWLAPGRRWAGASELRPLPRPLMAVGPGSECESSLKKKSNKSRLNRLAREGGFRFVQLEGREALAAVFREIIDYTDLRQGAVHDSLPFRSDPLKAELYLSMMEVPGLLHATVSMVGDRVAAAHVGARDGRHVLLGLITHSPFLAQHSPGKLHVLQLGAELGRQGFANFDLTPGGDYKDRFATHHDEAYVLDLFFSRAAYRRHALRQAAARVAKRALSAMGTEPQGARDAALRVLDRAGRVRPDVVARRVARAVRTRTVGERLEFRIYRVAAEQARAYPDEPRLSRDSIADLLLYEPAPDLPLTRSSFLATVLQRLEQGQHVYTLAAEGKLLHFGWLIPRQETSYSDYRQPIALPPGSAVIYDGYTFPEARGRGLQRDGIQQRVRDAAAVPGTEWIFTGVSASNPRSWRNVERMGFSVYCRCYKDVRRGRTTLSMECE